MMMLATPLEATLPLGQDPQAERFAHLIDPPFRVGRGQPGCQSVECGLNLG